MPGMKVGDRSRHRLSESIDAHTAGNTGGSVIIIVERIVNDSCNSKQRVL